jgi:hypothetical protein
MRRVIGTIAVVAFGCILGVRLPYLYYKARPVAIRLCVTSIRLTQVITHAPAPLLNCDLPEDHLVQNSYLIILKSGYTVQQHKAGLCRSGDLDAVIETVLDSPFPTLDTDYFATIDNPSLLESIRADLGVVAVECDMVMHSLKLTGFGMGKKRLILYSLPLLDTYLDSLQDSNRRWLISGSGSYHADQWLA